ncbi:SgrR family transcriptional regulator, partial [Salmonella enterica]
MPSGRLQQQFIRLWQCCDGKTQDTTLNELARPLVKLKAIDRK